MAPAWAINTAFVLGFLLGITTLLWTLILPPTNDSGSGRISLGKWEFQFNGRAVFQLGIGVLLILFPVLLSAAVRPSSTAPPPRSFQQVDTIPEPSYTAFTFLRDTSVLDLREHNKGSLWRLFPFVKRKSHPANLTNAMLIRKSGNADVISFTYGTSGTIDIRCLTHSCTLKRAIQPDKHAAGILDETWEVTADVKDIPVGAEFQIITEVTYWNAFDAPDKQWFATYPNAQVDAETAAVLIQFPEDRPFREYSLWGYTHRSDQAQRFAGKSAIVPGRDDLSLYWEVPNAQGTKTLEVRWTF